MNKTNSTNGTHIAHGNSIRYAIGEHQENQFTNQYSIDRKTLRLLASFPCENVRFVFGWVKRRKILLYFTLSHARDRPDLSQILHGWFSWKRVCWAGFKPPMTHCECLQSNFWWFQLFPNFDERWTNVQLKKCISIFEIKNFAAFMLKMRTDLIYDLDGFEKHIIIPHSHVKRYRKLIAENDQWPNEFTWALTILNGTHWDFS